MRRVFVLAWRWRGVGGVGVSAAGAEVADGARRGGVRLRGSRPTADPISTAMTNAMEILNGVVSYDSGSGRDERFISPVKNQSG